MQVLPLNNQLKRLQVILNQLQMFQSMAEAMEALPSRVQVEHLRIFTALMKGNSSLQGHSDLFRQEATVFV